MENTDDKVAVAFFTVKLIESKYSSLCLNATFFDPNFPEIIAPLILQVAKTQKEAEILINEIFSRITKDEYFQGAGYHSHADVPEAMGRVCKIQTHAVIALAKNQEALKKTLTQTI